MHTIKLKVQDSIYDHIMFLLGNINKKEIEIEIVSDNRSENMTSTKMQIKELLSHKDVDPFKTVDDPVSWQKEQRDEW